MSPNLVGTVLRLTPPQVIHQTSTRTLLIPKMSSRCSAEPMDVLGINHGAGWMQNKIPSFGNQTPCSLLKTEEGRTRVERVLLKLSTAFTDGHLASSKQQVSLHQ